MRVVAERNLQLPIHGAFEVCFLIPDGISGFSANRDFLSLLTAHNPDYWRWPLWMDSSIIDDKEMQPRVVKGAWEASVLLTDRAKWRFPALDFWRIDPVGKFYHRRGFIDDLNINGPYPEPNTLLDPDVQMAYVAEAFVVGQAFAKAMNYRKEPKLDFSFRWSGLKNRSLVSWLNPNRIFLQQLTASDDGVIADSFLPVDAAPSSIFQYVFEVTKPLFQAFDGHEFKSGYVESVVNRFLAKP